MQDNNACRKLILDVLTDPIFQGVIRLFVLLFENQNVMFDIFFQS